MPASRLKCATATLTPKEVRQQILAALDEVVRRADWCGGFVDEFDVRARREGRLKPFTFAHRPLLSETAHPLSVASATLS